VDGIAERTQSALPVRPAPLERVRRTRHAGEQRTHDRTYSASATNRLSLPVEACRGMFFATRTADGSLREPEPVQRGDERCRHRRDVG
jgi:hypothetical protein